MAANAGRLFAIDTDARAPSQLGWLSSGCARAEMAGLTRDRILSTLPAPTMLFRLRP